MADELNLKRIIELQQKTTPEEGDSFAVDNPNSGTNRITIENLLDPTFSSNLKAAPAEETKKKIDEVMDVFAAGIDEAVDNWLDQHPEATTTVEDGSITELKFTESLKLKTIKDYVTPEMFGAVGDGVTDDTDAINDALTEVCTTHGTLVFISGKHYKVSDTLEITDFCNVIGTGAYIEGTLNQECILDVNVPRIKYDRTLHGNNYYIEININGNGALTGIRGTSINAYNVFNTSIRDCNLCFDAVSPAELNVENIYCIGYGSDSVGIKIQGADARFSNIHMKDCNTAILIGASAFINGLYPWVLNNVAESSVIKNMPGKTVNPVFLLNAYADTYKYFFNFNSTVTIYAVNIRHFINGVDVVNYVANYGNPTTFYIDTADRLRYSYFVNFVNSRNVPSGETLDFILCNVAGARINLENYALNNYQDNTFNNFELSSFTTTITNARINRVHLQPASKTFTITFDLYAADGFTSNAVLATLPIVSEKEVRAVCATSSTDAITPTGTGVITCNSNKMAIAFSGTVKRIQGQISGKYVS